MKDPGAWKTHLDTPQRERMKWDEMKSCHVMLPCHVGKGGLWLSHLAMFEVGNSQVRLQLSSLSSSLAIHQWWEGWPPADTLWFKDLHPHTHTHTRQEWISIWSDRNWILKRANQPRSLDQKVSKSCRYVYTPMLSGLRWPGQTVMGSWPPALGLRREKTEGRKERSFTSI